MIRTNVTDTENVLRCIKYLVNPSEHTIIATRTNREQVQMAVQHFGDTKGLHLAVISKNNAEGEPEIKQEIELSFASARILRDFLNRPEVTGIIEEDE